MAGVDVSVKNEQSQAAIVVVTYPGFLPVETVLAQRPTPFPYVPGLLSFREGPVLEEAFEKLKAEPDVFLFDGMGIAHPRRIGIASHMGLWLQRPTIGCGKTLLCGRYKDLAEEKGSAAPLDRPQGDHRRGAAHPHGQEPHVHLPRPPRRHPDRRRTRPALLAKYRLPEPIRLAHNAAGEFQPYKRRHAPPRFPPPFHALERRKPAQK